VLVEAFDEVAAVDDPVPPARDELAPSAVLVVRLLPPGVADVCPPSSVVTARLDEAPPEDVPASPVGVDLPPLEHAAKSESAAAIDTGLRVSSAAKTPPS
jgi:hypothetical protein